MWCGFEETPSDGLVKNCGQRDGDTAAAISGEFTSATTKKPENKQYLVSSAERQRPPGTRSMTWSRGTFKLHPSLNCHLTQRLYTVQF